MSIACVTMEIGNGVKSFTMRAYINQVKVSSKLCFHGNPWKQKKINNASEIGRQSHRIHQQLAA